MAFDLSYCFRNIVNQHWMNWGRASRWVSWRVMDVHCLRWAASFQSIFVSCAASGSAVSLIRRNRIHSPRARANLQCVQRKSSDFDSKIAFIHVYCLSKRISFIAVSQDSPNSMAPRCNHHNLHRTMKYTNVRCVSLAICIQFAPNR